MSEFINWREHWYLGIPMLDEQHRLLADCLNRLVRQCACTERSGAAQHERQRLGQLLEELYARAKQHFGNEEVMMREQNYPGYGSHQQEHVMLLAELKTTFINRFAQGCSEPDPLVFKALKAWYIVHVTCSDREFAHYVLNSGAGRRPSTTRHLRVLRSR